MREGIYYTQASPQLRILTIPDRSKCYPEGQAWWKDKRLFSLPVGGGVNLPFPLVHTSDGWTVDYCAMTTHDLERILEPFHLRLGDNVSQDLCDWIGYDWRVKEFLVDHVRLQLASGTAFEIGKGPRPRLGGTPNAIKATVIQETPVKRNEKPPPCHAI
jgi:hypothetical protein